MNKKSLKVAKFIMNGSKDKLKEYDNAYKKLNYKQYAIRLNKVKDKKIIKYLDKQEDKTNYIKSLILKDMK